MSSRTHVLPLGFGLSAVLCLNAAGTADEPPARPRPPARVYTNEDLDRVHPLRDETGVDSVPAVAPSAPERTERTRAGRAGRGDGFRGSGDGVRGRGETYWRAQAERAREKVLRLDEQAEELRSRIARAQDQRFRGLLGGRRSGGGKSGDDRIATLQARLAIVERRAREVEADLADRARRDGALPGWLR